MDDYAVASSRLLSRTTLKSQKTELSAIDKDLRLEARANLAWEEKNLWGHRLWIHLQSQLNLQHQRERRNAAYHAPAPCHSDICMQRRNGTRSKLSSFSHCGERRQKNLLKMLPISFIVPARLSRSGRLTAFPPGNDVLVYREPDHSRTSLTSGPCLAS